MVYDNYDGYNAIAEVAGTRAIERAEEKNILLIFSLRMFVL